MQNYPSISEICGFSRRSFLAERPTLLAGDLQKGSFMLREGKGLPSVTLCDRRKWVWSTCNYACVKLVGVLCKSSCLFIRLSLTVTANVELVDGSDGTLRACAVLLWTNVMSVLSLVAIAFHLWLCISACILHLNCSIAIINSTYFYQTSTASINRNCVP